MTNEKHLFVLNYICLVIIYKFILVIIKQQALNLNYYKPIYKISIIHA